MGCAVRRHTALRVVAALDGHAEFPELCVDLELVCAGTASGSLTRIASPRWLKCSSPEAGALRSRAIDRLRPRLDPCAIQRSARAAEHRLGVGDRRTETLAFSIREDSRLVRSRRLILEMTPSWNGPASTLQRWHPAHPVCCARPAVGAPVIPLQMDHFRMEAGGETVRVDRRSNRVHV